MSRDKKKIMNTFSTESTINENGKWKGPFRGHKIQHLHEINGNLQKYLVSEFITPEIKRKKDMSKS